VAGLVPETNLRKDYAVLLLQVRQPFFHCLDFQLEVRQVGLQLGSLLGLG
jgi:hypothetical protein